LRTERVEAFEFCVYQNYYEYSYISNATNKGIFIVPPCKIEEIYSPDVFGRTATEFIIIN
jgi:uncharacterized protein YfaS (alpha-2-macroglobulin family)